MPRGEKDHGTNWLIQHYGPGLLRMSGLASFHSCRPTHARLTLPQAVPDGLFDVVIHQGDQARPILLEIEAYPSRESEEQLARDMDVAKMALGVLPDTVLIVLQPRGNQQQRSRCGEQSALGWSRREHEWKLVELWKIPTEELLTLDDVGLIPLLVLTRSKQPPETLVQQSKEQIERLARPAEKATLLTITAIMAGMRSHYVEHWLSILGGKNVLEHSSVYRYWMAENTRATRQAAIVTFLKARFKSVPEELAAYVHTVTDLDKLEAGITLAGKCKSLDAFQKRFAKL